MDFTLIGLFFQVYVANTIYDQDLAILSNDTLLSTLRSAGELSLDGGRDTLLADILGLRLLRVLAFLLCLHTLLATIPDLSLRFLFLLLLEGLRRCRRSDIVQTIDTSNASLVTPSHLASMTDVAFNKFTLALPAKIDSTIMQRTTNEQIETEKNADQARAETGIIVTRAAPGWEAVLEEVIIALTTLSLQDLCNDAEAGVALASLLHEAVDFFL